jgi:hypothetical protein
MNSNLTKHTLKNVNSCLNTKISINLVVKILIYIQMLFIFLAPKLIRHLWQLKIVVLLHRCLIHAVLLKCLHLGKKNFGLIARGATTLNRIK